MLLEAEAVLSLLAGVSHRLPSRAKGIMIIGTDTGVGKTYVACALLQALNRARQRTIGFKPVASGCDRVAGQLRHADALALQQAASIPVPYADVNPVVLEPAIAPHIAAKRVQRRLRCEVLCRHYDHLAHHYQPDVIVVEGAGGWYTPINDHQTLATFAIKQQLPVLLVVGMRLGCLNHACLTEQAILSSGLPLLAWIANRIEPDMLAFRENVDSLKERLTAPFLAMLPFFR